MLSLSTQKKIQVQQILVKKKVKNTSSSSSPADVSAIVRTQFATIKTKIKASNHLCDTTNKQVERNRSHFVGGSFPPPLKSKSHFEGKNSSYEILSQETPKFEGKKVSLFLFLLKVIIFGLNVFVIFRVSLAIANLGLRTTTSAPQRRDF